MPRQNFSLKTIKERLAYCGWQCEGKLEDGSRCLTTVSKGRFQCDHHLADNLGGKPVFENARILCIPCHKAKTAQDMKIIAKSKRVEAKELRVIRPKGQIRSPGFAPPVPKVRSDRLCSIKKQPTTLPKRICGQVVK